MSYSRLFAERFPRKCRVTPTEVDPVLQLYQSHGLFMRVICGDEALTRELSVLANNQRALEAEGIHTTLALKAHFEAGRSIQGFKFRPASWFIPGVSESLFYYSNNALIINPLASSAMVTHCYKSNIGSGAIGCSNPFNFARPNAKDVRAPQHLSTKLREMEVRRCGEGWDRHNAYFGLSILHHTENLMHYGPDALFGILVGHTKLNAERALSWQKYAKEELKVDLPFYSFSNNHRSLNRLTHAEVACWARDPVKCRHAVAKQLHVQFESFGLAFLDINKIKELQCSLAHSNPSPLTPVSYQFIYENQKIFCGYQDGMAIFKIDQKVYLVNQFIFQQIKLEHYGRLMTSLVAAFEKPEVCAALKVGTLKAELALKGFDKRILVLTYQDPSADLTPQSLLKALGYDQSMPFTVEVQGLETKLYLPMTQMLDKIHLQVKALEAGNEPVAKRTRRG